MPSLDFASLVLEIVAGIFLLFAGGEIFVQGSVALALILGLPELIIGLTIVSLGTSSPELFVSIGSIFKNSDALAISNVVGSNIFNVMVVLGSSALVLPLKVESRLVRRDVPLLLAVSAAVWGMASGGKVTWQAGVALITALIINTIWEIRTIKEGEKGIEKAEPDIDSGYKNQSLFITIAKLLIGLLILTLGSNILVTGATKAAIYLGVSEAVIGLTIVSAGTSLPELITSLVAAIKGRTDLAIGNVIGSNLLNQLLVLGSAAIFTGQKGLTVSNLIIERDLPFMVITTLACMPIFWTKGRITRTEGGSLLAIYFLYLLEQIIPYTFPEIHFEFKIITLCVLLPISIIVITFKTIKYWNSVNQAK